MPCSCARGIRFLFDTFAARPSSTNLDPEPLLPAELFLALFPGGDILLAILALLLLLIGSGLISGSEVAFFSLTHNDFAKLEEDATDKSARQILKLKERPRRLLAAILISNNFINVAIVVLSDFIVGALIPPPVFERWGASLRESLGLLPANWELSKGLEFLVIVVGVTSLLLLFGEVAPKIYAKINKMQMAKMMAGPLRFLVKICAPLSELLVGFTGLIEKRLERRSNSNMPTREDIDEAIDLTVDREQNEREVDILKSIVKFGEVSVKQIMRSRVDVISLDVRSDYGEVLKTARESGYSRIPVYETDFDHITGILFVKDLLGFLNQTEDFEWQSVIRPNVFYVPEAKKIDDLLKEFQQNRSHMAVVVDEYGGSSGIVTLEDIMEEVIGEIRDEFDDDEEIEYEQLNEKTYIFEGKTMINDMCRVLDLDTALFDPARGDADSVAGLMLEMVGHIPRKGREIAYRNYRFSAVAVNPRRVERVRVVLP